MIGADSIFYDPPEVVNAKRKALYIEVNGYIAPIEVREAIITLMDSHLALIGVPGVGKTFTALNIFPELISETTGLPYELQYIHLGNFKDERSLLEHTEITTQGNTQFASSNAVKRWEEVTRAGKPLLLVIDEPNRNDPKRQNVLLPLLEERPKVILALQHRTLELHPMSRVVLLCNPTGAGTWPLNEAIQDRVEILQWPSPSAEVMARMLVRDTPKWKPENVRRKGPVNILDHKVDYQATLVLCEAVKEADRFRQSPVSIREMKRYRHILRRKELNEAVACIKNLLLEKISKDNSHALREMTAAFAKLQTVMPDEN